MDKPQYINWIVREDGVVFEDQQPLNCYRLSYVIDDATSQKHFKCRCKTFTYAGKGKLTNTW